MLTENNYNGVRVDHGPARQLFPTVVRSTASYARDDGRRAQRIVNIPPIPFRVTRQFHQEIRRPRCFASKHPPQRIRIFEREYFLKISVPCMAKDSYLEISSHFGIHPLEQSIALRGDKF